MNYELGLLYRTFLCNWYIRCANDEFLWQHRVYHHQTSCTNEFVLRYLNRDHYATT